jgi:hypothetical protein
MPRLTNLERLDWMARLREPLSMAAFGSALEALTDRLGHWALVQNSPFRDAYTAHRFAQFRNAKGVQLGADPPDFHLAGVIGCDTFEVVETYPEGRRRSDEYKARALADDKRAELGDLALTDGERALFAAVADPEEDWKPRAERATALLAKAAEIKAAKDYPPDWGLVVKLDLGGFVLGHEELVLAQMTPGTGAARHCFREIWVLWESAHLIWRDGHAVS